MGSPDGVTGQSTSRSSLINRKFKRALEGLFSPSSSRNIVEDQPVRFAGMKASLQSDTQFLCPFITLGLGRGHLALGFCGDLQHTLRNWVCRIVGLEGRRFIRLWFWQGGGVDR